MSHVVESVIDKLSPMLDANLRTTREQSNE